jgi:hypothetical protein
MKTRDLHALQRKHPRPKRLSDPFHDNTPESLRELLSKSDTDMRWADFACLLGPHLPAGTYEEVAYFLPLAFDYIGANEKDALTFARRSVGSVPSTTSNSPPMASSTRHELRCGDSSIAGLRVLR